jgi:hypothetical protein
MLKLVRKLVVFSCIGMASGAVMPEGTLLEIRMDAETGTRISRVGDQVAASLIAPAAIGGTILLPAGARLEGHVRTVKKLGWNPFRHTATIEYVFDRVVVDGWLRLPVETRLVSVDTAREKVDGDGRVHGIRPAMNVSSALAAYSWRLVMLEPIVGAGVWATKFAFARPPDPEIHFPKGTEMVLRVMAPLTLPSVAGGPAVPTLAEAKSRAAGEALASLPSQRASTASGQVADVVNVVLMGSESEVRRAFLAAGWAETEKKTVGSLMRTYRSIVERKSYRTAPMSTMTLDGVPAQLSFQKSLNSFARRHHIRLWRRASPGGEFWVGAATEDVGIGFSMKKLNWTHFIDQRIDGERAKVTNDLAFTGCVDAATYLGREELPGELAHGAGLVHTDGRVAVAQLNHCSHAAVPQQEPRQPGVVKRFLIGAHHELVRSNFLYVGYHATKLATAVSHFWTRRPRPGRPMPLETAPARGLETYAELAAPLTALTPDSGPVVAPPGFLEPQEIGEGSSRVGERPDQDPY